MNTLFRLWRWLLGERPGMFHGHRESGGGKRRASLLAPTIVINTDVLLGDVSFYQGEINFNQMMQAGIEGVIIRAGQNAWEDVRFQENWYKALQAGLPRGSYWFYDSRKSPESQAALWWSILGGEIGELWLVADFEESYGGAYGTKAHFKKFLQEIQRLSGLPFERIAVYTAYYWWMERVGNDPFFKQFPLWLAWYNQMSVVKVPLPWVEADLVLWQFTSSGDGKKYGVSSEEIDLNWWCCNEQSFQEFAQGGDSGGGGDPVTSYTGTCKYQGAKIWDEIGGEVIANMNNGQAIKGNLISGIYMHLTSPIYGWTKKEWLNYTAVTVPSSPSSSVSPSVSPSSSASPSEGPPPDPGTALVIIIEQDSNGVATGVTVNGEKWVSP